MISRNELAYLSAVNEVESTGKDPFELDDIVDYAGATVLDIGVSLANSLAWTVSGIATLGQGATDFGLDTGEILHSINEDAGNFYDQNKDLVQLSSFIGGIFVPGALAAKTMKWAKNGRTWIGGLETAIKADEAKALSRLKEFSKFDSGYRSARNSMRLHTLGAGIAEGLVYELEFAAMMNKHAFMDNDYDISDFSLGVALGGLVGPLRLIQQSKKFRTAEQESLAKQLGVGKVTTHISYQGENAGQTLAMKAYQYNNWKTDNLSEASSGVQEAHKIAGWEHINEQTRQIYTMSLDDGLKGRINFTVGKGVARQPRSFDYTDSLYATPDEIIGKMNVVNPSTFPGVEGFRTYSAETPMFSTIDSIIHQGSDGVINVTSGAMAREILTGAYIGRKPRQMQAILESIPANLEVGIKDGIETIHLKEKATKETKQWIADYLGLKSIANRPVRFTGEVGEFSFNKAAIVREGILQELDTLGNHNIFISYDTLLDTLSPSIDNSRAGIIDQYFDGHILSELEAKAASGINSYKNLSINTRVTLIGDINYKPFQQSVANSDRAWLEGQYAWINTERVENIFLVEDNLLPKLQAIINGTKTSNFPKVSIKGGPTFTTRREAAQYLWDAKQSLVHEGLAIGASATQIAKVTNLPIETVDTIIATRGTKLPFDERLSIARYINNDPEHYLKQVPIQAEGNLAHYGQIEEAKASSILDATVMDDIDQAITKNIIEKAQIPNGELKEFMNEVLFSDIAKTIKDQLPKALAAIENKWNLFTSADQALRELGPLGELITTMGNNMITYVNRHVDNIRNNITPTVTSVAQDLASRTQFSQFRQALHAIPIEQAQKLVYDSNTGKIVRDIAADGSPIYMTYHGLDQEIQFTPKMQRFMEAWLPMQEELLELHNTVRELHGLPRTQGAGIWLPYSELHKEFVAYKIAKDNTVELITARSAKDLAEQVDEAQRLYGNTHEIITKGADSTLWNELNRYADLEDFKIADISARKAGVTTGEVTPGIADIDNLFSSIQGDVWRKYRKIATAANSTIHNQLDFYAQRDLARSGGGKGFLGQKVQQKVSTPGLVSATLLNQSMTSSYPILDIANNMTTVIVNTVLSKVHDAWNLVTRKSKSIEEQYANLTKALEDARIPMPWKDTEAYQSALKRARVDDVALHRIQQSQSLLVMLNLRLLEASHAAVTTASLPVILQGELTHVAGKGGTYPLKHMMDAGKFWAGNSDEVIALRKIAEEKKYTQAIVAETTRMMQDFHTNTNIFGKYQPLIEKLSFFSDFAEGWVREQAFANGYLLAKEKFPQASMDILAAHAYAFTNRTMGNYVPRQRPVMFQGTFGAMIGLYQTFMLTMGQNMFRYLEAGDAKAMTNLLGAQTSVFGFESLPFFQQFNHVLGGYYSDDHEDFRTTLYQVFGNDTDQTRSAAEFMLFGLPSAAFGAGIYTRGTLDPRTPLSITGDDGISFKPAVFDAAIQSGNLVYNLATGVASGLGEGGSIQDLGKSILQGFAAQSLWRPVARWAELAMGQSFDQKGEVISNNTGISSIVEEPFAVISRAIGSRPLKEQALRNLRFSNSYYNTIDADRKARTIKQLRRVLTEEPDSSQITALFEDYVAKGGTYRGWRQIYNGAYMAVDTPYANRLVEDMEKQPAIRDIVDSYAY